MIEWIRHGFPQPLQPKMPIQKILHPLCFPKSKSAVPKDLSRSTGGQHRATDKNSASSNTETSSTAPKQPLPLCWAAIAQHLYTTAARWNPYAILIGFKDIKIPPYPNSSFSLIFLSK